MDALVGDNLGRLATDADYDDFLLREGLEVLAGYRSIRDEAARLAVRQLIDALAQLPVN